VHGERVNGERVADERAWAAALAEHQGAVDGVLAGVDRVAPARWWLPAAPGRWSPAEEVLHVTLAYEFACAAVRDGAAMRLRVPRLGALVRAPRAPPASAAGRDVPPRRGVATRGRAVARRGARADGGGRERAARAGRRDGPRACCGTPTADGPPSLSRMRTSAPSRRAPRCACSVRIPGTMRAGWSMRDSSSSAED
jgi:hypothetical protein